MRLVPKQSWSLGGRISEHRRRRLLDSLLPEQLLERIAAECLASALHAAPTLVWQQANEAPGYFRINLQFPVSEDTFDRLFNGRAGYRAQYYLSPEEGILFNRAILTALTPAVRASYEIKTLEVDWRLIAASLEASHAKIWIANEKNAYGAAEEYQLNPPRWMANNGRLGRRAPLPQAPAIDLKGSFINPDTNALFVDESKLGRPCDLHATGYT